MPALLALILAARLVGQTTAPTAPGMSMSWSKAHLAIVDASFKRGTDADLDAMVPVVKQWFDEQHVPAELWKDWTPTLQAHGRTSDVAELALRGILGRPESKAFMVLLPNRITALMALNQPAQALQAAKSYYNVTDAKHLPSARSFVQQALVKLHPDDPTIAATFAAQQAAATPPGDAGILHGVVIDSAAYDPALAIWKARAAGGNVLDTLCYADLLLMADKAAEAETVFRKILPACTSKPDITGCMEGIAASLRAQDENNVRAAQYLATAAVPEAAPKPDKNDPLP